MYVLLNHSIINTEAKMSIKKEITRTLSRLDYIEYLLLVSLSPLQRNYDNYQREIMSGGHLFRAFIYYSGQCF